MGTWAGDKDGDRDNIDEDDVGYDGDGALDSRSRPKTKILMMMISDSHFFQESAPEGVTLKKEDVLQGFCLLLEEQVCCSQLV